MHCVVVLSSELQEFRLSQPVPENNNGDGAVSRMIETFPFVTFWFQPLPLFPFENCAHARADRSYRKLSFETTFDRKFSMLRRLVTQKKCFG